MAILGWILLALFDFSAFMVWAITTRYSII